MGQPVKAKGKAKVKPPDEYLTAITGEPRRTRIVTYDVESKDGGTEKKGFSRAFLVGFYDGEDYFPFRNARPQFDFVNPSRGSQQFSEHQQYQELIRLDPERRAIAPGGCVDRFLRFLMGDARHPHTIRDEYASRKCTLYAHNGGRFDATFLLAWLRLHADEFDMRVTCVASRAQKVVVTRKVSSLRYGHRKIHRKMPSWTFIDSALILPMSLDEAGKTFCAKDPEVQKLTEFDLDTHSSDARWEIYNRMDCLVLHRALSELRDLVEGIGGELGITAPATSMKTFRRAFLTEPIDRNRHFPACRSRRTACRDQDDACLHTWIRRGYHGGRTEIVRMIAPPGSRYYDRNSSYPASMMEPMPVGEATEVSPADFFDLLPKLQETQIGFVEADVFIPATCVIPPLPVPHEDKLKFPTGHLSGVWSWDELRLIFDPMVGGKILRVHRSVWFRKRPVFREFVEKLYAYRTHAKKNPDDLGAAAMSELVKLILNSHYGKYGMHPEREELITLHGGHDPMPGDRGSLYPKGGTPLDGDHINGDVWIMKHRIDAPYMIPQIAAQITALSRIALWHANVAGVKLGGMPCYNDTDSVVMSAPDAPGVISGTHAHNAFFRAYEIDLGIGNALGQWKREFPTWVLSAQFLLPKSYLLTNELGPERIVKLKGVGKLARTEENYHALARGEKVRYQRVEQHRTVLKEGRAAPRYVWAEKRIVSTYDKRELVEGGDGTRNETRAIHMPSDEQLHAHVLDADREWEQDNA